MEVLLYTYISMSMLDTEFEAELKPLHIEHCPGHGSRRNPDLCV